MITLPSNIRTEIRFIPTQPITIYFYLHGPKGTVQFGIYTGWYNNTILTQLKAQGYELTPMSMGLDYHTHVPQYDNHIPVESCPLLNGSCYCGGSMREGESLFEEFILKGEDVVWKALLECYTDLIGPSDPLRVGG